MSLPKSARVVVAVAVIGGLATLGYAVHSLVVGGVPNNQELTVAGVFGVLVIASWLWPLMIFHEEQSLAVHADEGFFIVLLLLARPAASVGAFALATLVAQIVRRRPLVKSIFNIGQVLTSLGAGLLVFEILDPTVGTITYSDLGAAIVGAVTYFVVNTGAVAAILAATGSSWRSALFEGLTARVMLIAGSTAVALCTSLVLATNLRWLPVAVLPLLILRQVLAGHFEARHDRSRLHGLFEATLEAHQSMGEPDVTEAVLASARTLLRCATAEVTETPGGQDSLSSSMLLPDGPAWLTVSGRSRTEPFDSADQALLDALAAVGAGALANASLYQEGRYQRERMAAITTSLGEGVCAVNRSGQMTFVNPAASTMLGWDERNELTARNLPIGIDGLTAPTFVLGPATRAMATATSVTSYDTRFQRADGSFFHVAFTASPIIGEGGEEPTGAVLVFRDISERKEFEEQLARHAFHDALTGLPNRRLFLDHLDHALRRSQRSNETHAVMFVDVDRFKLVNDNLGHYAGDRLLMAIAEVLQTAVRPGDMLARFGGDEFTILLEGVNSTDDPVVVAERILDRVREPITLPDGHDVVATLSIGIALTTSEKSRDDILHDADVAMYQAKSKGLGHYEVFDVEAMGMRSADRIDLEASLRRALDRDELEVYYQPLFSLVDRQIVGTEALVRWNHPEFGLIGPDRFIAVAEDTGLILPLGRVVLEVACRQARSWNDRFGLTIPVGVNLSVRQFQQAGLVAEVRSVLESTGVDPSQLCLEITESLAMDRVERTNEILYELKELGVRLAIDDFGTGHSSLSYLASFPVDVVKIDRSFIEGVDTDPVKSAIVAAVLALSQAVGTTTVIEGVETIGQLEHVQALGCPVAQGFYFAYPMSATAVERLLCPPPSLGSQWVPFPLGRSSGPSSAWELDKTR